MAMDFTHKESVKAVRTEELRKNMKAKVKREGKEYTTPSGKGFAKKKK